ncbi:MAG: LuxR family transcriptional regulator [Oscillospiraceae bacterium]|nr:LuxR family transcriptional regulator [Oscillospiraceae bacterium]
MMKTYPSRFIVPVLMTIAVVTVVIQSALVEAFRSNAAMLYLVYMAITVLLLIIYMNLEPYIVHTLARRFPAKSAAEEIDFAQDNAEDAITAEKAVLDDSSKEENILDSLTKREKEVLELIGCGYTNSDIAKILFISEHTVNDYTKKIYRKLDVHSRHAAARIINRYGSVL